MKGIVGFPFLQYCHLKLDTITTNVNFSFNGRRLVTSLILVITSLLLLTLLILNLNCNILTEASVNTTTPGIVNPLPIVANYSPKQYQTQPSWLKNHNGGNNTPSLTTQLLSDATVNTNTSVILGQANAKTTFGGAAPSQDSSTDSSPLKTTNIHTTDLINGGTTEINIKNNSQRNSTVTQPTILGKIINSENSSSLHKFNNSSNNNNLNISSTDMNLQTEATTTSNLSMATTSHQNQVTTTTSTIVIENDNNINNNNNTMTNNDSSTNDTNAIDNSTTRDIITNKPCQSTAPTKNSMPINESSSSATTNSRYFDLDYAGNVFQDSMSDKNAISLDHYLEGFKELMKFFHSLGSIFLFVTSDLENKIGLLENYRNIEKGGCNTAYLSIQSTIEYETKENLLRDTKRQSGARTILRLHRALEFLSMLMMNLSKLDQEAETAPAARDAYSNSLAKHHPWTIRTIASFAMRTLPQKKQLVESVLGKEHSGNVTEINEKMLILANVTENLFNVVDKFYEENNIKDLP